jgi:phosphoglycolate phosphatase
MTSPPEPFHGVQALIFDLDGTLIDSALDLALSVNAALRELGRPPLPHKEVFGFVGHGAPVLIQRALGHGTTEQECLRGLEFFLTYYRAHMLDNTVAYPGVREGLAQLAGFSLAVLTNKPVRFSREILEGLDLAHYFRFIYGGNSFGRKKPDPIGVHTLLRDFGATPRQAMIIGDSEVDIQTARNAGTWSCGVTYGLGSHRLGECPPDILINSLHELPAHLADHAPSRPSHSEKGPS